MNLKQAIISRDNCSEGEVDELIKEMINRVNEGEDPEEVLFGEGFEPDYVMDILDL